jgi:hypothetical protein
MCFLEEKAVDDLPRVIPAGCHCDIVLQVSGPHQLVSRQTYNHDMCILVGGINFGNVSGVFGIPTKLPVLLIYLLSSCVTLVLHPVAFIIYALCKLIKPTRCQVHCRYMYHCGATMTNSEIGGDDW